MRIVYFVNQYPVLNQPVYEDEAKVLLRKGHQVWIVPVWGALAPPEGVPEELKERVLQMGQVGSLSTFLLAFWMFTRSPRRQLACIRRAIPLVGFVQTVRLMSLSSTLSNLGVERVHAHFANAAALVGLLSAEAMNIPFSCTGHGTEILLERASFLPLLIERARPFITISDYNVRRLKSEVEAAKVTEIKVIRCGIDLNCFSAPPARGNTDSTPVILCVSWFRKVKGLTYLIDACGRLRDRGHAFECVIVGGGDDREQMERKISELQLESFMTLTGPLKRPAVLDWYRRSDLFVLPSLSEGIPLVLMEAMAMKLPVVATRITGIPELVTEGVDGLLTEPEDGVALSDAMETLLADHETRHRMGNAARSKVELEFNLDVSVSRLLDAFDAQADPK